LAAQGSEARAAFAKRMSVRLSVRHTRESRLYMGSLGTSALKRGTPVDTEHFTINYSHILENAQDRM